MTHSDFKILFMVLIMVLGTLTWHMHVEVHVYIRGNLYFGGDRDFTESKILSLNDQRWHLCDMTRLYKNVTWFRHHKNMWKRNSKMNTFFYPNIPKLPILHQRYFNWALIIDFLMNQNYKPEEKIILEWLIRMTH